MANGSMNESGGREGRWHVLQPAGRSRFVEFRQVRPRICSFGWGHRWRHRRTAGQRASNSGQQHSTATARANSINGVVRPDPYQKSRSLHHTQFRIPCHTHDRSETELRARNHLIHPPSFMFARRGSSTFARSLRAKRHLHDMQLVLRRTKKIVSRQLPRSLTGHLCGIKQSAGPSLGQLLSSILHGRAFPQRWGAL